MLDAHEVHDADTLSRLAIKIGQVDVGVKADVLPGRGTRGARCDRSDSGALYSGVGRTRVGVPFRRLNESIAYAIAPIHRAQRCCLDANGGAISVTLWRGRVPVPTSSSGRATPREV